MTYVTYDLGEGVEFQWNRWDDAVIGIEPDSVLWELPPTEFKEKLDSIRQLLPEWIKATNIELELREGNSYPGQYNTTSQLEGWLNIFEGYESTRFLDDKTKEKIRGYVEEFQGILSQRAAKLATKNAPKPGHVYIARETGQGRYKIGCSTNVTKRIKQLEDQLPAGHIELVMTIPTQNRFSLESDLHARFTKQCSKGEWFDLSADDLERLKKDYSRD